MTDGGGMPHFWSFCHREVSHGGWGGIDHLLVSITLRSAAADGSGMGHFLVFHHEVHCSG